MRGTCRYALQTAEVKSFKGGQACGAAGCIYKLRKVGSSIYAGQGYRLAFSVSTPIDVTLSDPAGRTTRFSMCNTCSSADHISGPLRGATFSKAGDVMVLTLPLR